MMSENDESILPETQSIDREELRQIRKERRKLKKKAKSLEKQLERDRKKIELKLGPKDQHVTIITREFAEKIHSETNNIIPSANQSFPEFNDKYSFPKLGEVNIEVPPQKVLKSEVVNDNEPVKPSTSVYKPSKNAPLQINLQDAIKLSEPHTKDSSVLHHVKQYCGNLLDSSQPERKFGKHREIPRQKRPTKLKSLILKEAESQESEIDSGIDSSGYPLFCDNIITDELNEKLKLLLIDIVKFQENLYKRCSLKGISKRRYITGFREVKNYLLVNKIQILIIAPNLKNITLNGVIYNEVETLKNLATSKNIPYVFALSRRIISRITLKKVPVSCVGILNIDGAKEKFDDVLELLQSAKDQYKNLPVDQQYTDDDAQISL